MNPEALRRRNASLHDRIQQVLQMHPELRDGTEAIALRQDLHVEAGAPFLERTREKLEDRARAIIERRPELEYYFGDLIPAKAFREINTRETQLEAALRANAALRVQAERLIAAYVAPESDRHAIINELITLFDGPARREAERLTREALAGGEKWQYR
jgi:hypothetical protein